MMTVPKCGLSSMVSFDGNHWEIGCNGSGSVNKASSNNGKNDHYNHLHHNGVYHHQSHEDCLSKIRKNKNSIESKLSSALQEKHRYRHGYKFGGELHPSTLRIVRFIFSNRISLLGLF